jgi:hypothetical protein
MCSGCLDCPHMANVALRQETDGSGAGLRIASQLVDLEELAAMTPKRWSPSYTRKVLNARERGSDRYPRETYEMLPPAFRLRGNWFAERAVAERFFSRVIEQAKLAAKAGR